MSEALFDNFKLLDDATEYRGRKVAVLVDGLPGWLVKSLISALEADSYEAGYEDGYNDGYNDGLPDADEDDAPEPKQQTAAQAPAA